MNALPPRPNEPAAEARKARHLRQLAELAELGMAMARAVAQTVLTLEPAREPGAATEPEPVTRFRSDPGLVFARLSNAVRQTIALEARIAADRDAAPPPRRRRPPPDPRRAALQGALRDATVADTQRSAGTSFRREIDERLEDDLEADPDGEVPIGEILGAICDDFGLTLNYSRLSDALLRELGTDPDPDPDQPASEPPPVPQTNAAPPGRPVPSAPEPLAGPHATNPHGPDPP